MGKPKKPKRRPQPQWDEGACGYEFESEYGRWTGWYRCVRGWLADGRWPEWNHRTGEKRYSQKPLDQNNPATNGQKRRK